jgi:hypothetical protein
MVNFQEIDAKWQQAWLAKYDEHSYGHEDRSIRLKTHVLMGGFRRRFCIRGNTFGFGEKEIKLN